MLFEKHGVGHSQQATDKKKYRGDYDHDGLSDVGGDSYDREDRNDKES